MPIDKHIINANLEAEGVINAQLDKSGYTEDETSVMAGKAAIAASITNKGVPADKTDSFHQLSEKVSRITTGEGGVTTLSELTDVDIFTPTSGQILKYDEQNDKWVNGEEKERVLSYEEYLALTEAEKMNSNTYYINNMDFSPVIAPVIYSAEERQIGVWINGKSLYQKSWVFADVITLQTNTWTNTPIKCSDYNFEKVVNAHITLSSTGTMYNYIAVAVDDEYVRVNSARPSIVQFDIITIQYTKTTDTSGSGIWTPSGIPAVHYSTFEQVIGTWIDGKPLYEKTIDCGQMGNGTTITYPHNISNISRIVELKGVVYNSTHPEAVDILPVINGGTDYIRYRADAVNVYFKCQDNWTAYNALAIIRYTKTTD